MDLKFGYNSRLFPKHIFQFNAAHCKMVNGGKKKKDEDCSLISRVQMLLFKIGGSACRRFRLQEKQLYKTQGPLLSLQLGYSYTSHILGAYCMTASHRDIVNYLIGNSFKHSGYSLSVPWGQLSDLHNPSRSHRSDTHRFYQQDFLDPWSPTGYINWRNSVEVRE